MSKTTKRLFAVLLVLTMVIGLFPTMAFAQPADKAQNAIEEPKTIGSSDDLWEAISALEDEKIVEVRGKNATADDYAKLTDEVIAMVEASESYKEGTIERHGDFFFWETKDGQANGYSPRLRAQMRETGIADADPEAYAGIETVSYADKGGGPNSTNVAVFQPYYGIDSSFTTQYKTEGQSIASATGGTSTTYLTTNATIDNIANAMQNCGVVIFDSHGDTDYYVSGSDDFVTQANTSYLLLQTNTGFTSADQVQVTGTYGSYYHAYYAGSYQSLKYYCADGTAIANHMSGNGCHNLVWMAICLGMATTGLHGPLREKGVEVVYGYSQSVSFDGDYQYEEDFWNKMKSGETVATAFAYMTRSQKWDPPYYSSPYNYNTLVKARYNYCAFPNVVSSEDTYQGHRTKNPSSSSDSSANNNNDANYGACNCQTVNSTWSLFGSNYTVTAVSNNTNYGTVSVSGNIITASPKTGYYASGYNVTSGTATVTQNGNTFTVNPSSDCTVQIIFAAKQTVTVTYMANGSQYSTASGYAGDAMTLLTTAPSVDNWTFAGWSDAVIADTTTKPSYYAPGASFTPTANTTLYAVYTQTDGNGSSDTYTLVTNTADLVVGSSVIITANGSQNNSLSTVQNSNNRGSVDGVKSSDYAVFTPAETTAILTLGEGTTSGTYSFYDEANNGYLYAASSSRNWLRTETTLDSNGSFTVSISGNEATITAQGSYTHNILRYNSSSDVFSCYSSGQQTVFLYQAGTGTTTYTTSPTNVAHEHSLTFVAAAAPTCTVEGNSAYWYCAGCGKYFSDANAENEITLASTVIAALGHDYVGVVTAPTATEQGYTTYTCSRCGDSYVDDYTAPLGVDYTVHFSVPAGMTKPADMVSNTNTGITLPTVEAPEGYTFLGWVTDDYDNVETRPAVILTGSYIAPQEITLKALLSYSVSGGSPEPTLTEMTVSDTFADGDKIVITAYGTEFALYQQTANTNYVANYTFTNNAAIIAADEKNWLTVTATDGGWYLGDDDNGYLYNSSSNYLFANSNKSVWTLTTRDGYLALTTNSRYLACRTDLTTSNANLWRMVSATATGGVSTLVIYKLTEGEGSTAYYTTILPTAHEHTPAAPVVENEVPAACTAAGSYDSVVYCTECGEELSRETVTVPALGHDYQVYEVVDPTCTEEGYTVYKCSRCGDEDMQDITDALGHDFSVLVDEVAPTCTETGIQEYKCVRCDATDLVETAALGHLPAEPVQENYVEPTATEDGGYDTVVRCQRCSAILSSEHTTLPATGPVEPVLDTSLRLYTSLNLGIEITENISVRKTQMDNFASWYIQVEKLDAEGAVLETYRYGEGQTGDVELGSAMHSATFTGITAKEMGVPFVASVHCFDADGNERYNVADAATFKDYIVSELLNTGNSDATRTLCADMLNYAAAAQTFFGFDTEHLVNANLSAAAAAAKNQFETKTEPAANLDNTTSANMSCTVSVMNRIVVSVLGRRLNAGTAAVTFEVKDSQGNVRTVLDTTPRGSAFTADYEGLNAEDMREPFTFTALVDGVPTGESVTWSVEGYVKEARASGDISATELALFNALLNYVDAVAALGN